MNSSEIPENKTPRTHQDYQKELTQEQKDQYIEKVVTDFHGITFYEHADVKKTKKSKLCRICYDNIPLGSSHLGFRFYGHDGDWPVFNVCNSCAEIFKYSLYIIEKDRG